MKKLIAMLLILVTVLGLAACGPAGETEPVTEAPIIRERVLEVGYGKTCITPTELPVAMIGGLSTAVLEDLFAIAVAFRDEEGNMYVHVVTDLSEANAGLPWGKGLCDMVRDEAQEQLGIDPSVITMGGIHNHSEVDYTHKRAANRRYLNDIVIPQTLVAIQQAIDDLAPAKMEIARTKTESLNFVRRYWLEDGTLYEGFTGLRDSEIVSHETEPDEEIQLVKFVREGKEDVLMVNWQCHATVATSYGTEVCADFVGTLRNEVEAATGAKCVFYQGAAGNLVHYSRIPGEALISQTNWSAAQKVGKAVAAYVVDAYNNAPFTPVMTGLIQNKRVILNLETRQYDEEMVENAKKVKKFKETQDDNYVVADYAKQFGIETIHHANTIIDASSYLIIPLELNIISIGDVAFTTMPVEFFDTTGMQIKDGSPFEMTILIGYSCGVQKYAADREAYSHGGYESYTTWHPIGTAELCVEEYLQALKEHYQVRFVNEE